MPGNSLFFILLTKKARMSAENSNKTVRVRFAPSPTGALHIGGVRTALYNYLFAKKNGGSFILRIEDTDQARYVPGAEAYIIESLRWFGILPDEGPEFGGDVGPYRQSERKDLYKAYVTRLIESGHAYYAFDTPESLEALREADPTFKYDAKTRKTLQNSLTLDAEKVQQLLEKGENIAVRMKVPESDVITFEDTIRGQVSFSTEELDDKVILKGDGMPTYHMANIVDDHLMRISHVIRGEEWLPSTAHHILLYRFFNWQPPVFAHLPLILKPNGHGKLSKRDGAKFGFPVFPLSWDSAHEEDNFTGFREDGFLPESLLNFLALLGWSPGDDREMFTIHELCDLFSLDQINKSGARFDIDKALWFNQQYIIHSDNLKLAYLIMDRVIDEGYHVPVEFVAQVCGLMKERVHKTHEIVSAGRFFFERPHSYEMEVVQKKYRADLRVHLEVIAASLTDDDNPDTEMLVKGYMQASNVKPGELMPLLRIAITGSMQGPDLIKSMELLGRKESADRIAMAVTKYDTIL
jgi:glutamyl-tRNA synthetase